MRRATCLSSALNSQCTDLAFLEEILSPFVKLACLTQNAHLLVEGVADEDISVGLEARDQLLRFVVYSITVDLPEQCCIAGHDTLLLLLF